jgi:hypothetical protein
MLLLLQAVEGAVAGGATVVQIREKDIDGGQFIEEARAIIRVSMAEAWLLCCVHTMIVIVPPVVLQATQQAYSRENPCC